MEDGSCGGGGGRRGIILNQSRAVSTPGEYGCKHPRAETDPPATFPPPERPIVQGPCPGLDFSPKTIAQG